MPDGRSKQLWLAIVTAADGVRFVAIAPSRCALDLELARYVADTYRVRLWPPVARRVGGLLRQGRLRAAITLYFARVGERWDSESVTYVDRVFSLSEGASHY